MCIFLSWKIKVTVFGLCRPKGAIEHSHGLGLRPFLLLSSQPVGFIRGERQLLIIMSFY